MRKLTRGVPCLFFFSTIRTRVSRSESASNSPALLSGFGRYAYQLTSLDYAYSGWEYFAVCLLNMQKALRAGPDADNIGTEQEEQCISIIRMIRCLYHQQEESRRVEAEVRLFLQKGLDERRWGIPELTVSVGNHSTTPLLELVLVICRCVFA